MARIRGNKGHGLGRIISELTRDMNLLPPVMASITVPDNMKEDKVMEIRGWSPGKLFDHALQILGKNPFGHKGAPFSR